MVAARALAAYRNRRRSPEQDRERKAPPTEAIALACDDVFPERRGWFLEYYEESKSWAPPGFRVWAEYEDKAAHVRAWSPGVLHGLLQTEDYAHALLSTAPGVTDEIVATRLPRAWEDNGESWTGRNPRCGGSSSMNCRSTGSSDHAAVMSAQMRHLATMAAMPNVTMQILPSVAHPAGASGFVVTDDAAYAEHVSGGYVFTDGETVSSLLRLFNSIHSESYRASESLRMIEGMAEAWAGGSPLIQTPTAETA